MNRSKDDRLTFALLVMAVWRISRMVIKEDGPFDALRLTREKMGVHKQETWVQRGLACIACVSFWAGLAGGVLAYGFSREAFLAGLAASAAVTATRKVID